MITSGTSTFMFADGAVLISSSIPGICRCSRTAFMFISRKGSTHCLDCEHFRIAPSEDDAVDDGPTAQRSFENAIV